MKKADGKLKRKKMLMKEKKEMVKNIKIKTVIMQKMKAGKLSLMMTSENEKSTN